jgi:RNA methyltransferase, TrmH family
MKHNFSKISKNKIKQIASLKQKKTRDDENLFIAEGEKIVTELLLSNRYIEIIAATADWLNENQKKLKNSKEIFELNNEELERVSSLKTPNNVIAVIRKFENKFNINNLHNKLTLVLDHIQDPGNLGTIIRLADWFGIQNIICSENNAELYNPKVIQATMGAFLRVNVYYNDLETFFQNNIKSLQMPVYGAFLNGENIYTTKLSSSGFIIMGNESKGISSKLEKFITQKITIPNFTKNPEKSESLNVSIATAIVCSEFMRSKIK